MPISITAIIIISILLFVLIIALLLPTFLKAMGYHPDYKKINYTMREKKALIVATNQQTLGDSKKQTGVYASELTIAYYEFLDAGLQVDVASIKGGNIPFEKISLMYPLASHADRRYLKDETARKKTKNSLKIEDLDFSSYDIIYMPGGWGAAYDLGKSELLGQKITDANAHDVLLGSVCHGALGFLMAKDTNGKPLVEGKTITAVTDKQIKELSITKTPQHPETELRKLGANYKNKSGISDLFKTLVVRDGNIVTGQNQNSSGETAQELLKLLAEKQSKR